MQVRLLSRMQLPLHATRRTPHGASRLGQAMPGWSVKARRAPSRYCRDARVYGHTTTAMHDTEYTPPPRRSLTMTDTLVVIARRSCIVFLRSFPRTCRGGRLKRGTEKRSSPRNASGDGRDLATSKRGGEEEQVQNRRSR